MIHIKLTVEDLIAIGILIGTFGVAMILGSIWDFCKWLWDKVRDLRIRRG